MAGPQKLTEEQRLRLIELRRMCDAVLDRLADRLPPDVLKQLRTFSAVGEWSELADVVGEMILHLRRGGRDIVRRREDGVCGGGLLLAMIEL